MPFYFIAIKRLHDRNKSGHWLWLASRMRRIDFEPNQMIFCGVTRVARSTWC